MNSVKSRSWFSIGEVLILVVGLLIATIMFFASKNALNLSVFYTPLIDTVMDVKLEVALGRDDRGAPEEYLNYMLSHLRQAQRYTDAMLDGAEDEENPILALKDEDQRQHIEHVKSNIHRLIGFVNKNKVSLQSERISERIPKTEFDVIFDSVLSEADLVEIKLEQEFARDLKKFHVARALLIPSVVVFSLVSAISYRRFYRRKLIADQLLEESHDLYRRSKEQLQNVIDGANLGFWDWNCQTGEHQVNDRWLDILGLKRSDIKNHIDDRESRIHPDDKQIMIETVDKHMKTGTTYVAEFRMQHKDGHWVWIQGSGAVVDYDFTHKALRLCGTHQDITERKEMEGRLNYLVTHDQLTRLHNRRALEERLDDEVKRAVRYNNMFSVFMIDIDHFKEVNDSYGHKIGDQLLIEFSAILNKFLRVNDFTARYGGEEFFVVLPETSISEAFELAERFRHQVSQFRPEIAGEQEIGFTISIGIASFPESGSSPDALIKAADDAMYMAKRSGRNKAIKAE